jgi:hypothetical protein
MNKIEPRSEPSSQKAYSSIVGPLNSGKFILIIHVLQKN